MWHRIVDEEPELRLPALIELAKLYEHRRPDLARAKALATQAYRLWQQAPDGPGVRVLAAVESGQRPLEAALQHRLSRLERRLARAAETAIKDHAP